MNNALVRTRSFVYCCWRATPERYYLPQLVDTNLLILSFRWMKIKLYLFKLFLLTFKNRTIIMKYTVYIFILYTHGFYLFYLTVRYLNFNKISIKSKKKKSFYSHCILNQSWGVAIALTLLHSQCLWNIITLFCTVVAVSVDPDTEIN